MWEGIGFPVNPADSPEKIVRKAGLAWKAVKSPLVIVLDGGSSAHPGFALVKHDEARTIPLDDAFLSIVYNGWEPVQNEEGVAFFKKEAACLGVELEAIGTVSKSRLVWALARSGAPQHLPDGEVWERGVLFSMPHTYGQTVAARVVMVRRDRPSLYAFPPVFRYGHRKKELVTNEKVGPALRALGDSFVKTATKALRTPVEQPVAEKFFKKAFPSTSKYSKPAKLAVEEWATEKGTGTRWGLFTAVAYASDNLLGNKKETSLESAWFGVNSRVKQKAMGAL